jgi:hypothetical protein
MRTLVLSDLHLGCAAVPGVFAGGEALPALLDRLGGPPLRVVLNGDTFDFIACGESFASDDDASAGQLEAFVDANPPAFAALARVLARGGQLVLRTGEHDEELALAGVQAGLREHFAAAGVAPNLVFQTGNEAHVLAVGGSRVAVVHDLVGGGRGGPGSRVLARRLLQPLRREFGLDFVDLLKPDRARAALAALAVNPTAAKLVFAGMPAASVWRGLSEPRHADDAAGLTAAMAGADLDPRERELILAALDPAAAIGSEPRDSSQLDLARLKLLRAALGGSPDRCEPTGAIGPHAAAGPISADESAAARRLAQGRDVAAVLAGHTQAAGFVAEDALCVVDTGAWVWRFTPPAPHDDAGWRRLMTRWQQAPGLQALRRDTPLWVRFTAALLEPRSGGGARLELIEWHRDAPFTVHASRDLPPA